MRRFEHRTLVGAPLALFSARDDLAWGQAAGAPRTLFVPNRLPAAAVAAAEAIAELRANRNPEPTLVYVGTLAYPPHLRSLVHFLESAWPDISASSPDLRLLVIGRCPSAHRAWIEKHARVRTTGYVEDLSPLLSKATGAVVPGDPTTGTFLRVLHFALAGIPVVGSRSAFRGLPVIGWQARTPAEWVQAIAEARGPEAAATCERARDAVWRLHQDPSPWDRLRAALDEVCAA